MAPAALLQQQQQQRGCVTASALPPRPLSGAACSTSGRALAARADRRADIAPAPTLRRAPTLPPSRRSPTQTTTLTPRATFFDQAWGTQIDGQSLASQLFSVSLLPYLGFLYHLRKREAKAPPLVAAGFAFLLVFVFATIPAGIYGERWRRWGA
jgi:hypothetical protein